MLSVVMGLLPAPLNLLHTLPSPQSLEHAWPNLTFLCATSLAAFHSMVLTVLSAPVMRFLFITCLL